VFGTLPAAFLTRLRDLSGITSGDP
ncbi:uncharacterized protein METZ01_LOCUS34005, partial [marine metagenome]